MIGSPKSLSDLTSGFRCEVKPGNRLISIWTGRATSFKLWTVKNMAVRPTMAGRTVRS